MLPLLLSTLAVILATTTLAYKITEDTKSSLAIGIGFTSVIISFLSIFTNAF